MKIAAALLVGAVLICRPGLVTACEVMPPWMGWGQIDLVAGGRITSVTPLPPEAGADGIGESSERWRVSIQLDQVLLGDGPYPYTLDFSFGAGCGVGLPPTAGERAAVFVARQAGTPPRFFYLAARPGPALFERLRDAGVALPPR